MAKIPKLKKKIHSFLIKEEGKISKKTIISVGTLITTIAASSLVSAGHSNTYTPDCSGVTAPPNSAAHGNILGLNYESATAQGTHNHCIETHSNSHSSHASHGSHGSHGQW